MLSWAVSSNGMFFVCFCYMLNTKNAIRIKLKLMYNMFLFDELRNRKDHVCLLSKYLIMFYCLMSVHRYKTHI